MLRPEVDLWWRQAKRDFSIAKHNHESRDYEAGVLFCEQAAQKALKALIIHQTSRPAPKIHNLSELGKMVGCNEKMLGFHTELSPHYTMTRYPDAAGALTTEIYDGYISLRFIRGTREVPLWCRNRLR